ncbi:MAG TPA: phosphatidate cytidylyltransferase [Termitinemataceae bacterium]|nr:phosphatidate cytidylyltransferase [Termitinemataceae bacterium]HOM22432.1 phosphatidate cytidylyltransferase [Termitinemataceae bacterium]HPP99568.1 phosphatidate cytidylyltransferase [Termitinemataceae bacterium]
MNIKKLIERLLIFFVGLPLIVGIVVFFPHYHHLAVNCIVVLVSSLGALEFSWLISKKHYSLPTWEALVLGALAPAASTLSVSFGVPGEMVAASFIFGATWLISSRIFSSQKEIELTIDRITSGLSVMIYPGLFLIWLIRLTLLPHPTVVLLTFLLMVFGNDSLAWAIGMTLGNGNRGLIPASPNKSVAGFIGGLLTSLGIGIGAVLLFPAAFVPRNLPSLGAGALLGLGTGIMAIIGDLAESTMKRSSSVKDSGGLIPGRGGILDSIDSLVLAAPVYYALYWILFSI